jgi:homoserine dehydrogenase
MLNIGLLGYGNIGKSVDKIITSEFSHLFKIIKVFDRIKSLELLKERYVPSYSDITLDSNIDIVIEVLGGDTTAYEAIKEALLNNKHVVSSNKQVVSKYFYEFLELAQKSNKKFLFDASVGGGIPVIQNLINIKKSDDIKEINGILNGTSNYILTKMHYGNSLNDSIINAQNLGLAERDISFDIDGTDISRKLSILSNIAFSTYIDPNDIMRYPLIGIDENLISSLNKLGKRLKYIGYSKKNGDTIEIGVFPICVDEENLLYSINNELNTIIIKSKHLRATQFNGFGAGGKPTSISIISDLMLINDDYKISEITNKYEYDIVSPNVDGLILLYNDTVEFINNPSDLELKKAKFYCRCI